MVLGRDPAKVAAIPQLQGAGAIRIDVTEPSSLFGRLNGFDACVQAVQLPNYPIEKPKKGLTFDRYDRRGTENLLAEANKEGVGRFLYVSGAGADPTSDKTWYRAKGRAEAAIERNAIAHVILRPSWAYGPGDRALNKFAAIARFSPFVPKFGVRPQRIQPVYVEDVALACVRAFESDGAWSSVLEIGGPDVLTMDEVIKTMCSVMEKRRLILPVPIPLAKIATAPLILLPKPPMSPGGVEFAAQDGLVDSDQLRATLGIEPVSFREGLSRYLMPK